VDGYVLSGLTENKYQDRSNAVGKRFGRLKTRLGFGGSHVFHSIRKTVTTQLDAAGIPEAVSARIVGHDIPTLTYGVYSGGAPFEVKRDAIMVLSYPLQDLNQPAPFA
jgi:integrase